MDKKKVTIIVTVAAIAIVVAAIVFAAKDKQKNEASVPQSTAAVTDKAEDKAEKQEDKTEAEIEKTESSKNTENTVKATEQVKVTPTFMYFISASDADFEKTNAMIEELKNQYGDKVKFDIVNVDENPEAKKNFPVDGQTPALIMLNTSNDISALEFKCNDKATLVKDIENALK